MVFTRRLRVSLPAASGNLFFTIAFYWCECLAMGGTSVLMKMEHFYFRHFQQEEIDGGQGVGVGG